MESWQRGRIWQELRGCLRPCEVYRQDSPSTIRAGKTKWQDRHLLSYVLRIWRLRGLLEGRQSTSAHPVRICSRHGQLNGRIQGILEYHTQVSEVSGRIYLGLRGSGTGRRESCHRQENIHLRRRLRTLSRKRLQLQLQRTHRSRPAT